MWAARPTPLRSAADYATLEKPERPTTVCGRSLPHLGRTSALVYAPRPVAGLDLPCPHILLITGRGLCHSIPMATVTSPRPGFYWRKPRVLRPRPTILA
ncbi:hypothetical protein NDU88_002737 [Pleurodeles waltl]|uniref:Uncharacterized protein n=1 Tax=Pleurodeles waltl TaxID=8319 RepID=A0AAV7RAV4_PLEWA|nr:hypothetical protein NDU88_002737 [Pleurodeles waltl]